MFALAPDTLATPTLVYPYARACSTLNARRPLYGGVGRASRARVVCRRARTAGRAALGARREAPRMTRILSPASGSKGQLVPRRAMEPSQLQLRLAPAPPATTQGEGLWPADARPEPPTAPKDRGISRDTTGSGLHTCNPLETDPQSLRVRALLDGVFVGSGRAPWTAAHQYHHAPRGNRGSPRTYSYAWRDRRRGQRGGIGGTPRNSWDSRVPPHATRDISGGVRHVHPVDHVADVMYHTLDRSGGDGDGRGASPPAMTSASSVTSPGPPPPRTDPPATEMRTWN